MTFKVLIFPRVKGTNITNSGGEAFQFQFVYKTEKETKKKRIQLRVFCPKCEESFILKDSVTNETIMRLALTNSVSFYYKLINDHCPKCHPENPIRADFWKV